MLVSQESAPAVNVSQGPRLERIQGARQILVILYAKDRWSVKANSGGKSVATP
jgi:hypothetical protein